MTKARDLANGGFGLVLIKPSTVVNGTDNGKGTVSFSAQTSVSLNDVFNSTYQNYLLLVNVTSGANDNNDVILRLRASGSDTSTGYSNLRIANDRGATTPAGALDVGGTTGYFLFPTDKDENGTSKARLDIFSPNEASTSTYFLSQSIGNYANTTYNQLFSGRQSATTQFTGCTIVSGGTLTGTISVYGYNK